MKKNKYITKILAITTCVVALLTVSCDDEFMNYSSGGSVKVTDPYVQIQTPVISFQAGTAMYPISFNLLNGLDVKQVTTLNVYSVFTDAKANGSTKSPEVLFSSYEFPTAKDRDTIRFMTTYTDLKMGITLNGNPLPDNELSLAIGAGWLLRFEGVNSTGDILPTISGNIRVAVLSPFAGLYKTITTDYYRINVQSGGADWSGEKRFIGSIDDTTFTYNEFLGPFSFPNDEMLMITYAFSFDIDFTDNSIIVPLEDVFEYDFGDRTLNCVDDASFFVDLPCAGSNKLVPDMVGGKHRIHLTYGYIFASGPDSGSRQFTEVLEKIVN